MSAALRLVDIDFDRLEAPTMSPASLAALNHGNRPSLRPSLRPSMKPTLVPSSRGSLYPTSSRRYAEEGPATQRSASVHPVFAASARAEAHSMLAVARVNVDLLLKLLQDDTSPIAVDALHDILDSIARLERRFG